MALLTRLCMAGDIRSSNFFSLFKGTSKVPPLDIKNLKFITNEGKDIKK